MLLELALDALLELLLAGLELAPPAPPTPVDVDPPVALLPDVAALALVEEVVLDASDPPTALTRFLAQATGLTAFFDAHAG